MARFWSTPETFRVEEVPAYLPCGEGSHVYVWIEKIGLTTAEAIRRLAQAVEVAPHDVGYAGMKDKHATTWQWLSFPETAAAALERVDVPGIRVLERKRHTNKLRVGHVRQNRFEVTLTEVTDAEAPALRERFASMLRDGVPNRYGQQRFGRGDNVSLGLSVLAGKLRERDRRKRTLLISAVQSAVFNLVLERRLEAGTLRRVLQGDVLQKSATGGIFTSTEPNVDQARLEAGELHTTGPMPGGKAPRPAPGSEAEALEDAASAEVGLSRTLIEANARDLPGTRRPLLMPVEQTAPPAHAQGTLTLSFALPAGAYATVVASALTSDMNDNTAEPFNLG